MKAIVTKHLGPTNTKGARIKASAADGNQIIVPMDYEVSNEEAHLGAAYALCAKMNWLGYLAQGGLKNGYVHVFVTDGAVASDALHKVADLLVQDELRMTKFGRSQSIEVLEARQIIRNAKGAH